MSGKGTKRDHCALEDGAEARPRKLSAPFPASSPVLSLSLSPSPVPSSSSSSSSSSSPPPRASAPKSQKKVLLRLEAPSASSFPSFPLLLSASGDVCDLFGESFSSLCLPLPLEALLTPSDVRPILSALAQGRAPSYPSLCRAVTSLGKHRWLLLQGAQHCGGETYDLSFLSIGLKEARRLGERSLRAAARVSGSEDGEEWRLEEGEDGPRFPPSSSSSPSSPPSCFELGVDLEGTVVTVTPACQAVLQLSPFELVGRPLASFCPSAFLLDPSFPGPQPCSFTTSEAVPRKMVAQAVPKRSQGASAFYWRFHLDMGLEDKARTFHHAPHKRVLKNPLKAAQGSRQCTSCQTTTSPEWRKGPFGPKTLCNACGLQYAKTLSAKKRNPTLSPRPSSSSSSTTPCLSSTLPSPSPSPAVHSSSPWEPSLSPYAASVPCPPEQVPFPPLGQAWEFAEEPGLNLLLSSSYTFQEHKLMPPLSPPCSPSLSSSSSTSYAAAALPSSSSKHPSGYASLASYFASYPSLAGSAPPSHHLTPCPSLEFEAPAAVVTTIPTSLVPLPSPYHHPYPQLSLGGTLARSLSTDSPSFACLFE